MKTILEITPTESTSYEMPDALYEIVSEALRWRRAKNAKQLVASLPPDLRAMVKIVNLPPVSGSKRGLEPSIIMVDDPPEDIPHINAAGDIW